jgi:hypothetical protein
MPQIYATIAMLVLHWIVVISFSYDLKTIYV